MAWKPKRQEGSEKARKSWHCLESSSLHNAGVHFLVGTCFQKKKLRSLALLMSFIKGTTREGQQEQDYHHRQLLYSTEPVMSLGGRKRASFYEGSSVVTKTGTPQDASTSFQYVPITKSRLHTEEVFPVRRLLSVMVIGILIVTITLVMTKLIGPQKGLCTTLACREFAELARRSLNKSVPPCEDFGRFVCGRWKKRKSSETSTRLLLYVTALEMLFKTLTATRSLEQRHSEERDRISRFFSSCIAVTIGYSDDVGTVRAYLEEAGVTWPRMPSNPDVMDTLLYLDSKLNWPSILQFHVKEEKRAVKVSIKPAMSFRELANVRARLNTREAKRRYFDVIFRNYGKGVPEEQAYSQVTEVEELMATKLESVMSRHRDGLPFEEIDIDQFSNDSSSWTVLVANWLRIPGKVRYYTSNKPFLAAFFTFWSQYGDSKMHLYVSWCAVCATAPFANRDLFRNHYGHDASDIKLRQHCLFLSYQIFGEDIFAEFSTKVFTAEVRNDLRNLVLAVRQSFVRRFSQSYFSESISLVSNWGRTDHVFFVLEYHQRNDFNNAARNLPDMSHSFATNWRIVSRRLRALNASVGTLGEDVLSGVSMFHLDTEVMDFILSPFALVFPMYDFELTRAIKYATIGGEIGVASAQLALGHLARQPTAQFELAWSHQCVKAFEKHAKLAPTAIPELASLSSLVDAFAESGHNDQRLPGLDDYSALQTFFIAWCLMRCHDVSSRRDGDEPCSPVLRLFDAFTNAFQCWPGSHMNPSTKCNVFESPNATV